MRCTACIHAPYLCIILIHTLLLFFRGVVRARVTVTDMLDDVVVVLVVDILWI